MWLPFPPPQWNLRADRTDTIHTADHQDNQLNKENQPVIPVTSIRTNFPSTQHSDIYDTGQGYRQTRILRHAILKCRYIIVLIISDNPGHYDFLVVMLLLFPHNLA